MAIPTKYDFQHTAERADTWGTEKDTAPVGLPIPADNGLQFGKTPTFHRLERARGLRGQHDDDTWNDKETMIPTVSFSDMLLTPQLVNMFLPGMLQKAADWSPATNVYTEYTVTTPADFPAMKASNEGYFFDFVRNSSIAAMDERVISSVMRSMTIKHSANANDGLAVMDAEFIGQNYTDQDTVSGTVTHASLATVFAWSDLYSAAYGATDIKSLLQGYELAVSNGAKFVSDYPGNEVSFGPWDVSLKLMLLGGTVTEGIKAATYSTAVGGSVATVLRFGNATSTANGDIQYTVNGKVNAEPDSSYDPEEIVTIEIQGQFEGTGATRPLSVEFYYA